MRISRALSVVVPVLAALVSQPSAAQSSTFIDYVVSFSAPVNRAVLTNYAGWFATAGTSTAQFGQTGTISVGGESTIGMARATTTGSGAGYSGGIYAGWTDTITINSVGLEGSHALATFALAADWIFSAASAGVGGSSHSEAYVDINMRRVDVTGARLLYAEAGQAFDAVCGANCSWSTTAISFYQQNEPHPPVPAPLYSAGVAYLTFDVIIGAQYSLTPGINSFVDGAGVSATLDASHTMTWGGVSLTSTSGQPLSYSITSTSGFDYAQPYVAAAVPEPSTYIMLVGGLAVLCSATRRRRVAAES